MSTNRTSDLLQAFEERLNALEFVIDEMALLIPAEPRAEFIKLLRRKLATNHRELQPAHAREVERLAAKMESSLPRGFAGPNLHPVD